MLSKIDIKFIHNWSPLIKKYKKFHQVLKSEPGSKKYIEGYNNSVRYDFGSAGSLTAYNIVTGTDVASAAAGQIIESELPWIDKLKQDMSELQISAITVQCNFGSLSPHRDGKEESSTIYHCKLNHIIDNYNACSYVKDGDTVLSYPSEKDTAWLLDTTKVHWVNGTGERYVFQICFHQKYSEVAEWFNDHPGLVYF
jgi:hypothetical protein